MKSLVLNSVLVISVVALTGLWAFAKVDPCAGNLQHGTFNTDVQCDQGTEGDRNNKDQGSPQTAMVWCEKCNGYVPASEHSTISNDTNPHGSATDNGGSGSGPGTEGNGG